MSSCKSSKMNGKTSGLVVGSGILRKVSFTVIPGRTGDGKMEKVVLVLIGMLLCASSVFAMDVTLRWDTVTDSDLVGYKIYYKIGGTGTPYDGIGATEGDSPIVMTLSQDENPDPNLVEFTIRGLPDDQRNAFVVTAYDDQNLESGYSDEVNTGLPAPENLLIAAIDGIIASLEKVKEYLALVKE